MARMPTLVISHGSPLLAVDDSAARRFLQDLGPRLPAPAAIVAISAHYGPPATAVTGAEAPETIHDLGGFPSELNLLRYPARGDAQLARGIAERLTAAGVPT